MRKVFLWNNLFLQKQVSSYFLKHTELAQIPPSISVAKYMMCSTYKTQFIITCLQISQFVIQLGTHFLLLLVYQFRMKTAEEYNPGSKFTDTMA